MNSEIDCIVVRKIKNKNKFSIIVGAQIIGGEIVDSLTGHELGKNTRSFFKNLNSGESIPNMKAPKIKQTKKISIRGKK